MDGHTSYLVDQDDIHVTCTWKKVMTLIGIAINAEFLLQSWGAKSCMDGLVVAAWECEQRLLPCSTSAGH